MAEPFRDGMSAAVARIEQLADENEQLKTEIQSLRVSASNMKTESADAQAHAFADRTLDLLARLDASIDRHAGVGMTLNAADSSALAGPSLVTSRQPMTRPMVPTHTPPIEHLTPEATVSVVGAAKVVAAAFLTGLFVGAAVMASLMR